MHTILFLSALLMSNALMASNDTNPLPTKPSIPGKSASDVVSFEEFARNPDKDVRRYSDGTAVNLARDMVGWDEFIEQCDRQRMQEEWQPYYNIATDKANSLDARLSTLKSITENCTKNCTSQTHEPSQQTCMQKCNAWHALIKLYISQSN